MPFKAIVSGRCVDIAGRAAPGLNVQAWMVVAGAPDLQLLHTSSPTATDGGFGMTFSVPVDASSPAPPILLQALQGQRPLPCRPVTLLFANSGAERSASGNVVLQESFAGSSADLGIAEIGQGLASVAGSIQQELARYPVAGGVYVLDEFELSVPVRLRVDEVGQIRAAVLPERSEAGAGELRMKIRPVLDVPMTSLAGQPIPIDALGLLGRRQLTRLREMRIFDVASLWRVLANPMSQTALKSLCLPIDKIRERAALLLFAGLPDAVAILLVQSGVGGIRDFLARTPQQIWQTIHGAMPEVSLEDVEAWQTKLRSPSASPRAKRDQG